MDSHLSPRCRPDGWCCGLRPGGSRVDVAADGSGCVAGANGAGSQELRIAAGLEPARRLLAGLSGRDLTVLLSRALYPAPKPARTLEDLGRELGVVKERAGVIEKRVVAQVRRRAASAEFAAVAAAAATLRHELGPVITFAGLPASFGLHGEPPRLAAEAELLVYLAGPYDVVGSRLVGRGFIDEAGAAVDELMAASSVMALGEVSDLLGELGVGADQRTWVFGELSGYRVAGEHLLRWSATQTTQADKAEAVLVAEGQPLTLMAISASIAEPHTMKFLRESLGGDGRFRRVGLNTWGLSAWGGERYPGTFPAMVAELERRGGTAGIDELAAVLAARFGTNPNSVDMYARTSPSLIPMGSRVRLRRTDEPYVSHKSLALAPNCFVIDGAWAWRVVVDHEALASNERYLPEAFATHLGLRPGVQLTFESPITPITVGWGIQFPSIGSLRPVAEGSGAHDGDLLLVRAAGRTQFDFRVVTQAQLTAASAAGRVALLCGNPAATADADVTAALAGALGIPDPAGAGPEDVMATLSARHDHDLLRAYQESIGSAHHGRPDLLGGWCCGISSGGSRVDGAADGSGCVAGAGRAGSQEMRIAAGLEQARQILARLSARELTILLGRTLTPAPKPARTLEALAQEFGITTEPVRQIEIRVVDQVRRWSALRESAAVAAAAATVRHELGPVIGVAALPVPFEPHGQPPRLAPEAELLAYLAGPYDLDGARLVRRSFMGEAAAAVDAVMGTSCVAPLHEATDVLDKRGVADDERAFVLGEVGYRAVGDDLLRWSGTQADKMEAILTAEGQPMTLVAISSSVPEPHAIQSLQNALARDRRFRRVGPHTWGLSAWAGGQ